MLDVGSGHGLFARLAVEAGAASVVAVEPDLRKTLAPPVHPRVRTVAAFDDAIGGAFDLVSLFDVIYRIPLDAWDPLFERARQRLRPGGLLLVKELDPEGGLKFAWNRAQERLWDRFVGMTLGDAFSYESAADLEARLARIGFASFRAEAIDAGYPHPHVLYTARRA